MKLTIKLGLGGSKRKRRDSILAALLPALVPMFSSLLSSRGEAAREAVIDERGYRPLGFGGCPNCPCVVCRERGVSTVPPGWASRPPNPPDGD